MRRLELLSLTFMDLDSKRRLHPRMTDSDWLVLRKMPSAIEKIEAQVIESGRIAILGLLAWTTLLRLICGYQLRLRIPLSGRALGSLLELDINARGYVENPRRRGAAQ